ncbi:lambda family phage portal protein [Rhizobium sp. BK181]|uniref:phage portal protein n=1 Tax=Rhizobium sp. BK181 TaxID=2587072 RepID=UPI001611F6EE|nr:phage portal protein [Rhizobium sp. BK181]MBB3315125.1 lambda family phage portal protein [Rhizobium sp. BK181]
MNVLDKVISFFDPVSGVNRAAARQLLRSSEKRDYAAAQFGRRNKAWRGRGTSATTEVAGALTTLRDRARDFVRNGWAGQRILDVLTSHVIGTGIMTVPNTGSDRADNRYRLLREEWEERSDIEGVLDYGGQQSLILRSMAEGGDSVLRMLPISLADAGSSVPLRLQGLEGDLIDTSRDSLLGRESNVRLGVQIGEWNLREGLYLHSAHPGDGGVSFGSEGSKLVAWNDLCHLYRPLRLGQMRGISWFAPILLNAKEIQDLMEAAIVQQRTQASFAGFLRRSPGAANPLVTKKDDEGTKVTRIEPGQIQDIGDSEITFANPSSQSVFGEAYKAGLWAMAAGAGISYDQLTGDLTQANYSSLRAGKIEFRRLVEQIQWQIFVPMVCRKVDRRFAEYALMSGKLPTRKEGYRVDHVMPAVEPIDPKKDLEADILAVRAGRMSPQTFISAWGHDWRKVVSDFDAFFKFADANNVPLDIDPRRPANGARTNAAPAEGAQND